MVPVLFVIFLFVSILITIIYDEHFVRNQSYFIYVSQALYWNTLFCFSHHWNDLFRPVLPMHMTFARRPCDNVYGSFQYVWFSRIPRYSTNYNVHFGAFLNRDTDWHCYLCHCDYLYSLWRVVASPIYNSLIIIFFCGVYIVCETQYHYLMLSNLSDEFIPRVSTRLIFAMFTRCLCLDISTSTVSFRRTCPLLHFVPVYDVFSFSRNLITSCVYMVAKAVKLFCHLFYLYLISVYVPTYQIIIMW
mgnify:CR=1 FL=1